MYDIDPPSPTLRLTGPKAATQPTLNANGQHLAQRDQSGKSPREAIVDHWARLHTAARSGQIGDPAQRLRDTNTLNTARAVNQGLLDLAYAIEADI